MAKILSDGCHVKDAEEFAETIRCNKGIKELDGVAFIDTTNMSPEQIGQQIAQTILSLTKP